MGWRALATEESGQDTVEYTLILALVAVLAVAILPMNAQAIASICAKVEGHLHRAATGHWQ